MKTNTLTQAGVIGVICITIFTLFTASAVYASTPAPTAPTGLSISVPENGRPTGSTISTMTGSVELAWTAPDGETTITGYQVYREILRSNMWVLDAGWSDVPNSDATTTSHTVGSLSVLKQYRFKIRSVHGDGVYSQETYFVQLRRCPFQKLQMTYSDNPSTPTIFSLTFIPRTLSTYSQKSRYTYFGLFIHMLKCSGDPENCETLGSPITASSGAVGRVNGNSRTFKVDMAQWTKSISAGELTLKTSCDGSQEFGDNGSQFVRFFVDGEVSRSAKAVAHELLEHLPRTPPAFAESPTATRSVDEGTLLGQPVGNALTATGTDAGGTLTYEIEDNTLFEIDSETGQIKTKVDLGYQTAGDYSVSATVTDMFGLHDTIAVTITVTDVEEPVSEVSETQTEDTGDEGDEGEDTTDTTDTNDEDDDTTDTPNTNDEGDGGDDEDDNDDEDNEEDEDDDNENNGGNDGDDDNDSEDDDNGGNNGGGNGNNNVVDITTTVSRGGGGGGGGSSPTTTEEGSGSASDWGGISFTQIDYVPGYGAGGLTKAAYQDLIQQLLTRISVEQVKMKQYYANYKAAQTPAERKRYLALFYQSLTRILRDILEIQRITLILQQMETVAYLDTTTLA